MLCRSNGAGAGGDLPVVIRNFIRVAPAVPRPAAITAGDTATMRSYSSIDLELRTVARTVGEAIDAGWSSSVARWAHNPEVAGSNPVPATHSLKPGSLLGEPGLSAFPAPGPDLPTSGGGQREAIRDDCGARARAGGRRQPVTWGALNDAFRAPLVSGLALPRDEKPHPESGGGDRSEGHHRGECSGEGRLSLPIAAESHHHDADESPECHRRENRGADVLGPVSIDLPRRPRGREEK